MPVDGRKRTTARIQSKRAAARRGPTKDQHARGSEPAMSRHRRPHSSRSMPQTSSEIWAGGMQHASTNAAHGESPKSFRLLSRGPVGLGERCTCYYLPFYEMQQSMQLALTVGFSVTKRQGDACEWEGMLGHGQAAQDAQADPQRRSNEMERAQEYGPARAIGVGVMEARFQFACRASDRS